MTHPPLLGDRYRIERELGHGAMATVYLAVDLRHGRQVAIKVLRPELALAIGPERFVREIQIVARLSHPGILPLLDSGEAEGLLYYVMPFVPGETLRTRLERDRQLPIEDAVGIAAEVADALQYAHRQGIVHRDIKPENILIESGRAMVMDFGIARLIGSAGDSSISSSGIAIGTPGYMSPEQAAADNVIDGRSDIYSLGCVLFEMLAGERPFTGPTPQAVTLRHIHERVPSVRVVRPQVPEPLQAVVEKCLAKVPADRYPSGGALGQALRGEAAPVPRRGWKFWMVLLAVLGIAGGSGWMVWRSGGWRNSATGRSAQDPTHLAVLSFQDQSSGGDLRPIADGLTADLIAELSGIGALHVRSASAVRAFEGAKVEAVARDLGVGTLVEGRVSGARERMRISVSLTDATTGEQFGSQRWERPVGDLFELEDQMVREIATFLRQRLGEKIEYQRRRSGARKLPAWETYQVAERLRETAWDLYQQGQAPAAKRTLARADSLFAAAEELDRDWLDPVLARGWTAFDNLEMLPPDSGASRRRWERVGIGHAERVLSRIPGQPAGLELRGSVRLKGWITDPGAAPDDPLLAEADLRAAAVPANPNLARTWASLSRLLRARGQFAEANQLAKQAYEADAFLRDAALVLVDLCYSSFEAQRLDDAGKWCAQGGRRFPDRFEFPFFELMMEASTGGGAPDPAKAWELLRRVEAARAAPDREIDRPNWQMMVAAVLARAGQADSARAVARRARETGRNSPALDVYEAAVLVALGRPDEAVTLLGRFLKNFPHLKAFVGGHPLYASLRNHPRFRELVAGS